MSLLLVLSVMFGGACAPAARPAPAAEASTAEVLESQPAPVASIQPAASAAECQPGWTAVTPGAAVNFSASGLPPDRAVDVSLGNQLLTRDEPGMTDASGSLSLQLEIPASQPRGLYQVSSFMQDGTRGPSCRLWVWPAASPPRIPDGMEQRLEETLACNTGWVQFSPDGQWAVLDCEVEQVRLVRVDESVEWVFPPAELDAAYRGYFVEAFDWSADGKYAYVGANPHSDGFWEPFHQAADLFQLDLQSGETSKLLEGAYYSFAFAPDGRQLAYFDVPHSPLTLRVRELEAGREQAAEIDSKYNTAGSLVWSPDSRDLLFALVQYDEGNFQYVSSSIAVWDGVKGEITRLLEGYAEVLVPVQWIDANRAIVQIQDRPDKKFELDLTSGELDPLKP